MDVLSAQWLGMAVKINKTSVAKTSKAQSTLRISSQSNAILGQILADSNSNGEVIGNQLPLRCPHLLILVLGRMLILPLEKILTSVEDPSSQDIAASPVANDPSSDLCFKIMSRWMKECFDSHSLCSKDSSGPLALSHEKRLPTRVIDVGNEGPEVFLLVTKGRTGLWVTLSHCVSTTSLPSKSTQGSCGHLMARTSKSRL